MQVSEIKTASPFQDLFPINHAILKEVIRDMKKNGFDESKPIVLWDRNSTVIDGHTRLMAANVLVMKDVPVVMKEFRDEERALEYAINSQKNRRSLTDKEILKCIAALDKKKDRTKNFTPETSKAPCGALGKSSAETAQTLGVSTRKVERARAVLDKASDEIKEAVESGEMSINAAYNKTVNPEKGSAESLQLAADEIEKIDAIIGIIKERLTGEQVKKLIKRLQKDF